MTQGDDSQISGGARKIGRSGCPPQMAEKLHLPPTMTIPL